MSWSTTPTLPERRTGAAWTTTAAPPEREHGPGWGPRIERVAAFTAEGSLSANMATTYPYATAVYTGSGTLSAVIKPIKTATVAFTAAGVLSGEYFEIKYLTAGFGATGGLQIAVNDGLSAIVEGGVQLPDGLSAVVIGGLLDGLTASVEGGPTAVSVGFTGSGELSASVIRKVAVAASLAATGTLSATVTGYPYWYDDFNRSNSTTGLGTNWVQRFNVTGINSNAAYPNWFNSWCLATPKATMNGDDGEASIVLGPLVGSGSDGKMVGLGFNEAGQGAFVYHDGGTIYIFSQTDWAQNWSSVASGASTIPTGGTLTIRRVGNVYSGLVNGSTHITWTDSGNTIPRDANHRLVDFAVYTPDSTNWRTVDSFGATAIPKPDVDIYADDFNRANASTLGSGWTTRLREMSIVSNAAHGAIADWNTSTPTVIMSDDDTESSVVLAPGTRTHILLGLGFNTGGSVGAFLYYNGDANQFSFIQQTNWSAGWAVVGSTVSVSALATGDKMTIRRIGNQYFSFRNGAPIHNWTDGSSVIARGSDYRVPALAAHTDGTNYRDLDSFETATVVGDHFNRTDSSSSAGPMWTNRYGTMGVSSNTAYAAGGDWCLATPGNAMPSNDMEASILLGTAGAHYMVGLGFNAVGEGAFLYCDGSGGWNIFNQVTWAVNWGGQVAVSATAAVAGDVLTLRRVGNVYSGYKNGVLVSGLVWTDSGNLVPRDGNHRLVDFAIYPGAVRVDAFWARGL